MKIYLAAPLFTQVERIWNRRLAALLERYLPGAAVTLPQDFKIKDKYNDRRSFAHIAKMCLSSIDEADCVLAVLDGADADSGTSFEVGYAYGKGKPIVGVRTDFRPGQEKGLNILLARSCGRFVYEMSFTEDLELVARTIAGKIRAVASGR